MQNQETFIQTIKAHEALIYKIARVYTKTREDLEDLYQEIIYQAWKSFPAFRDDARLSTWLYRIALNTSITQSNKAKRTKSEELQNFSIGTTATDHETEEQFQALYAEVQKLNPIEKALVLLYLEGRPYDEIASITGFSLTNVGTRLGRIKQKLKKEIKK